MLFRRRILFVLLVSLPLLGGLSSQEDPPLTQLDKRLIQTIQVLESVSSGKSLVRRAKRFWALSERRDFLKVLEWSTVSRTDAVLTRSYDPLSGEETQTREVKIYLKSDQKLSEAVLDLAHELVHATHRPAWDPYDPNLTAADYLQSSIEGKGGEVEAVAQECQIGIELREQFKIKNTRCDRYIEVGQLNKKTILEDFYRVGIWFEKVQTQLGSSMSRFPSMLAKKPTLYSSTGNAPYPVALLKEYEELNRAACQNTRRRYGAERSIASAAHPQNSKKNKKSAHFLLKRCKDYEVPE